MAKAKKTAEGGKEQNPNIEVESKGHYQEWRVEIKTGTDGKKTFDKLKVSREVVKITDEEAETLNHGVLNGGNNFAFMYFKPE